jgi:hypothetical protein
VLRGKNKMSQNKSIQDYVVAPDQMWLDGIAKLGGQVVQFVATPEGSGYSVEAQLTGSDAVGGIQFEVVPAKYVDPRRISLKDVNVFNERPETKMEEVFDA